MWHQWKEQGCMFYTIKFRLSLSWICIYSRVPVPSLSHHTLPELQSIHLPFLEAASVVTEPVLHQLTVCSYLPPLLLPQQGKPGRENPFESTGNKNLLQRWGGTERKVWDGVWEELLLRFHLCAPAPHLYAEPGPLCSAARAWERSLLQVKAGIGNHAAVAGGLTVEARAHTHTRRSRSVKTYSPLLHSEAELTSAQLAFNIHCFRSLFALHVRQFAGEPENSQEKKKQTTLTHHLVEVDTLIHWRLCSGWSAPLWIQWSWSAWATQPGRGAASWWCKRPFRPELMLIWLNRSMTTRGNRSV